MLQSLVADIRKQCWVLKCIYIRSATTLLSFKKAQITTSSPISLSTAHLLPTHNL